MGRERRTGRRRRGDTAQAEVATQLAAQPVHNLPVYEILDEEGLETIHRASMQILSEIGIDFYDDEALFILKEHGADVEGETARFDEALVLEYVAKAPVTFTQLARNPERNVVVGGNHLTFAPVYGPPFVMDMERGRRSATLKDFQNFVRLSYLSPYLQHSGGLFMDMSIHDFDMARYIMNKEVVQVYAAAATLTGGVVAAAGDIDTAVVTLTFEDGSMAVIDNSRQAAYGYDQRLEVFGSKGMALVDNNKPDNHVYYHEHGAQSSLPLHFFMERYTASYLTEMQAFVKAVKGGHELPVSGEDGLKAARIAVAAQQSVRQGAPVTLGEVIV